MKPIFIPLVLGVAFSGAVFAQSADTTANSPAATYGNVPTSLPAPRAVRAIGFDNGPLVNSPGTGAGGADESVLQSTSLSMNTIGFGNQVLNGNRVADDFVVPAGGWDITNISFYAYQTGSTTTSTMTGVTLQIWNGVPGAPGSAVVWGDSTTNVMTSTGWSGIYRVTETTAGATNRPIMENVVAVNATFGPGTYWLDWATDGSLGSGPWAPPVTINGQTTTGNGLQSIAGGAYDPALDGVTATQQGFPFVIELRDAPPVSVSTLSRDGLLLLSLLLAIGGIVAVGRRL